MDLANTPKPELKKRIREIRGEVREALAAGKKGDVKKLRRQAKRLKRRTRQLAAAGGTVAPAPAAPETPPTTAEPAT